MSTGPVAVYCASSNGSAPAYQNAARSVGNAVAKRGLVYGGGSSGLMGVVSQATLDSGGRVVGVVPAAMLTKRPGFSKGGAAGEGSKVDVPTPDVETANTKKERIKHGEPVSLVEKGRETVETIIVNSMHDRKVLMAERATGGFVGLPGGFGTFEEILEVVTWSQLSIHNKPVVLVNIYGYWEPLRALINNANGAGFIHPENVSLVSFIDGPSDHGQHVDYDWGADVLRFLDAWEPHKWAGYGFDWSRTVTDGQVQGNLDAV
ncbi:hypothetical protein BKA62DRAFT_764715 [Auriculariales sp. MPI-PUGE-AT-0066]|nr:hypothetical protein BKA62DRAFT_764715 [Auriculariales sp. MPI-PUGE-AT-0066]